MEEQLQNTIVTLKTDLNEAREKDNFLCQKTSLQIPNKWDNRILAKEKRVDPNLGIIFQWNF